MKGAPTGAPFFLPGRRILGPHVAATSYFQCMEIASFNEIFVESLLQYWEAFLAHSPRILAGIIVFLIFLGLAILLRRSVKRFLNRRMADPLTGRFLVQIAGAIIIIIGVSVALQVVGLGRFAGGLLAGAGVGAFIIGFAFKDIGENLLAGIMLAFARPFRIGDTVEVNGVQGVVLSLNLRNTRLKTVDGKDVYIPNGSVIKNNLFNHTIDGFMRYEITLGIDQDDDFDRAREVLLNAARTTPGVLNDRKEPIVMISGTDSNAVLFRLLFWVDTFDRSIPVATIRSNVMGTAIKALIAEGFYLPNSIVELRNYRNTGLDVNENPKTPDK